MDDKSYPDIADWLERGEQRLLDTLGEIDEDEPEQE